MNGHSRCDEPVAGKVKASTLIGCDTRWDGDRSDALSDWEFNQGSCIFVKEHAINSGKSWVSWTHCD